ncbi:unnamed protein product [Mytilus edulis]|uniref:Uncharacterized protein n=1 Tax=Mytilus edulis TaxID=6550 RepID=A0A8S3QLJ8_MYTED|nr:unnamed protein product [Mytilus edulis]
MGCCLSVPPNNQRVISCPEHTTINIHDVWNSNKHGCPAYKQIHKIYIRNFKIHCEGDFYFYMFYERKKRRYRNSIQKPRRKLDTRSNPTYESETDVKINYSQNLNMESSIYTEPVELENDQDIVRTPHDYVNTDNITYDYARESNYLKDDTSENMEQEVGGTYQTKEMNYNTYSHLQDTFIDSDDTTYDHAIHNTIIEMSENDYCVSRCQMSDDDYDVSGNHNRSNHMDSSNNIYN